MYSVNGVPLDNPARGWSLQAGSKPLSQLVREVTSLRLPGVHGTVQIPDSFASPTVPIVVRTPRSGLEALYALFTSDDVVLSLTGTPSRSVAVEFLSATIDDFTEAVSAVDFTAIIRLSGAFWRDTTETISAPVTIASGSQSVPGIFPGMSAPVQDAIVRVRGGVGSNMIVQDAGGSWFSYAPSLTTSQWLRFDSATGQAWVTPSDVWVGGTDVSGDIDYGGPRGIFEITPRFTDPSTRAAVLTVSTLSRSGTPQIWVRGRGAYLI